MESGFSPENGASPPKKQARSIGARVLLLDNDPIAGRAMQGILARGHHECVVATNSGHAWKLLRGGPPCDIVFVELELSGENGVTFIERARADPYLKNLPIVVYTSVANRAIVKRVLSLRVGNFLIKPYVDESIFRELAKATTTSWKNGLLAEEKPFAETAGITAQDVRILRHALARTIERLLVAFDSPQARENPAALRKLFVDLGAQAENAGAGAVAANLSVLLSKSDEVSSSFLAICREDLIFASRLLTNDFQTEKTWSLAESEASQAEEKARIERVTRLQWVRADLSRGPMVDPDEVGRLLDQLKACPVIDSVAASFQMMADKGGSSLNLLNDMVVNDPGLAANVLLAAAHLAHDEMTQIEDAALAASLLGSLRLSALGHGLPLVAERTMEIGLINWADFWTFQVGVSRFALFACQNLELASIEASSLTAGLLHDLGRLIIAYLFPQGMPAMMEYATELGVSLAEAERRYINWNSHQLGARFARSVGLPPLFCNVIEWAEEPENATTDIELVAVVSFARQFCLQNKVGACYDLGQRNIIGPISESKAWKILQPLVFPGFNLTRFGEKAQEFCAQLRQSLSGH